jgi:hypothetical protein
VKGAEDGAPLCTAGLLEVCTVVTWGFFKDKDAESGVD